MSAPLRLTDPGAALAALLALAPGPVAPRRMPAAEAVGLVLAENLVAQDPSPPVPMAARDGWAVVASDTDGAGPHAPAILPTLPPRVALGDPLPAGTVAAPLDLTNIGALALIVLIRTFLSFSLEVEINGHWPWQGPGRDPGAGPPG